MLPNWSRRRFLAAIGAVATAARGQAIGPSLPSDFSTPLRLPGAHGLMAGVSLSRPVTLTAAIRREQVFEGRPTDLFAFRTPVGSRDAVNPLLIARAGETVDVTLANRLGEDTTIHWHGLLVDERNDGSGMAPVRNAQSFAYRFPVRNRGGTYWYHPHPHDRTGAQIHLGMAGVLLIDDPEEDALRKELGLVRGRNDVALLIQDKQVDARNRIRHSMGEDDWIGNRMLVNYTPEPYFDAAAGLYRFRLLNGSNARTYLIAFVHRGQRLPMALIGTDGGLLARSQRVTEAFLAPAQRIDVLVDFSGMIAGSTVMLGSERYDPMENDDPGGGDPALEHPGAPPMGAPMSIMKINIGMEAPKPARIPDALSSFPALKAGPRNTRAFRLHAQDRKWFINGYNFHDDMRAVKARVARGSTEVWEIRNDVKSMPHPMHLHGFQFHVIGRRGSPPQVRRLAVTRMGQMPQDLGLVDTVLVWPGETVAIAIDFSQPFSGAQHYMFHCHNLEHEDQGMMMTFAVEDPRAA